MESEARLAVEEMNGKREEQERRKADDLSTGSESHLKDGLPSLRQRGKTAKKNSNKPHGKGKPENRKKERKRNKTIKISKKEAEKQTG